MVYIYNTGRETLFKGSEKFTTSQKSERSLSNGETDGESSGKIFIWYSIINNLQ